MRDMVDDEQQSYRGNGLRRHQGMAGLRLLSDVPHRLRRCAFPCPGGARNAARGTSATGCPCGANMKWPPMRRLSALVWLRLLFGKAGLQACRLRMRRYAPVQAGGPHYRAKCDVS